MPVDYSKYPPNWKSEIVPRILARANHRCERCGAANNTQVTSLKLKLQDQDGRYKLKAFWVTSRPDLLRMRPFAHPGSEKTVRVVLTIAHLDHDETNHDVSDDRLQAMCQYCHLNYDAKEKYRRACAKPETNEQPATGGPQE